MCAGVSGDAFCVCVCVCVVGWLVGFKCAAYKVRR
jgi:hypothetical protein